ncbi:MAG: dihydropteroate synthase [Myxococcaceae bacterium]|nr:dihydropteroate synthase [Myxococcaceae bacterium]
MRRRVRAPDLELPLGSRVVLLTGLEGPAPCPVVAWGGDAAVARTDDVPEALRPVARGPRPFPLGGHVAALGARTLVLGIVNVTPDSFSDGGRFATADEAVRHGLALVEAGADWLDVGGESTRPGAPPVEAAQELARVLPVLRGLRSALPNVPLSIDTQKPEVARLALAAGAALVNDVSGFADPKMAEVVAAAGAAACVMHLQGTPQTMQRAPRYEDVVHEVAEALDASLARGESAGVPRERMLVDPGIGFGKTLEHNLALLRHLDALRGLRAGGVLLGTSRKSFLGVLTGQADPAQRALASAVSVALAAGTRAVDVARVHDVRQTREALAVAEAVRAACAGGERW